MEMVNIVDNSSQWKNRSNNNHFNNQICLNHIGSEDIRPNQVCANQIG